MEKWKEELGERIARYSNLELLTDTLAQERGDDYDGGMTSRGAYTLTIFRQELATRLYVYNFLTDDEAQFLIKGDF